NCDSCAETSSCGCGDSVSSAERHENQPQVAQREERGERHEAGYNSETRINSNQPMPAPAYGERRSDSDRQGREGLNESRETRQNSERTSTQEYADRQSNNNSKSDSDKTESSSDKSSDQQRQE